jgi:hypothetical protein
MKYKDALSCAEEARANEAVRAVAKIIGWDLKEDPVLIAIRDTRCFYVERADLLVMPGVDGGPAELAAVQREIRCRALLISEGRTTTRAPTLYAHLRLCVRGRIEEHGGLRLWLGEPHDLWLLSDPDAREPEPVVFRLSGAGLCAETPPWRTQEEMQAGLARANRLVPRHGPTD